MALIRVTRAALVAFGASAVSAEQTVQIVASAAEPAAGALPLYDCHAEYDMWKTAWTPDWKAWCCEHEQRGCPSTTTTTATSSTATTTVTSTSTATSTRTSTSTATTTTSEGEGCDAVCEFQGVNASCADRVRWAATHETSDKKSPCEAAHDLVLSQCSICGGCSLKAAGSLCSADEGHAEAKQEKSMKFRQKFQEPAASSSQIGSTSSSHRAGLGFLARCSLAAVAAGVPLAIVLRRSLRTASMQSELSDQIYHQAGVGGDEEETHE